MTFSYLNVYIIGNTLFITFPLNNSEVTEHPENEWYMQSVAFHSQIIETLKFI